MIVPELGLAYLGVIDNSMSSLLSDLRSCPMNRLQAHKSGHIDALDGSHRIGSQQGRRLVSLPRL